jgi:hypothetical protein
LSTSLAVRIQPAPSVPVFSLVSSKRYIIPGDLTAMPGALPTIWCDMPAHLHADILRADAFRAQSQNDASVTLRINSTGALGQAERAADALDLLVGACRHLDAYPFLRPLCVALHSVRDAPFDAALRSFLAEAAGVLADHKKFLQTPVTAPEEAVSSPEIFETISRLAAGEKVFGVFAFRQKALKPAIDAIRILSRAPADDAEWRHVRDYLAWRGRFSDAQLRWRGLAPELGADSVDFGSLRKLTDLSAALNDILIAAPKNLGNFRTAIRQVAVGETPRLWPDEPSMRAMRTSLRNAASAVRLAAAREEVTRLSALFGPNAGRIGALAKSFLTGAVGRGDLAEARIEETWTRLLEAIDDMARHRPHFEALRSGADEVADAGAPEWADRLRSEVVVDGQDPQTPADWRQAWDWAAAQRYLADLDQRDHVAALAAERAKLDAAVAKGFEQVVRERTFYALANSMTGPVRAALMMFATALRRIGRGTGKGALRHRRDARKAMAACYDGVPCWIMPSWRVAEQLPGELGTFDLVIMDEASQSDIKEVTALLRGRKILVVGDDKQVSPTAAFIDNAKIDRLERTFLTNQPFKTLLLPGASLYDLAKVMFPDKFVMLREHFRCVEPIIRFSTQFYTEALVPLRIPTAHERIDPPLVDIYVPNGRRTGDKINLREAEVIVDEVLQIVGSTSLSRIGEGDRWRSIGVISLIGSKQRTLTGTCCHWSSGEATRSSDEQKLTLKIEARCY